MHEAYTRTGKITYSGRYTDDNGIEIEIVGVPLSISLEKDGCKLTVETFKQSGTVKLNTCFEYESDALIALDAIIAAAIEAKRTIESRHLNHAHDLKTWANELKEIQKRCRVCNNTETLEAHHLESKHYSPSLMLSLGNGIVLCKECHKDFHTFCGAKKASRRDFLKWLQVKVKGKTVATKKPRKPKKIEKAKEYALFYGQKCGEIPSTRELAKLVGCTEYVTRQALKQRTAYEIAIQYYEKHQRFPSYRQLAEIAKCSKDTAGKAVKQAKELKGGGGEPVSTKVFSV